LTDDTRFRLATLNLLWNPERRAERLTLVIDELLELNPDAVCFQEVPSGAIDIPAQVAAALGFEGVSSTNFWRPKGRPEDEIDGTAIIARAELRGQRVLKPNSASPVSRHNAPGVPITGVAIEHRGHPIDIVSAHLTWGADSEAGRLDEVRGIDEYARVAAHRGSTVLLGGDFNAVPETDTNRWLSGFGQIDGDSTVWVDAWTVAGSEANAMTSRNDNDFASSTAASKGIAYPAMIPQRRIDYLKAFGWVYGRSGQPLAFGRWADSTSDDGLTISDHYGIWADFLLV
jgi:endonuclease/exonuclease/phosphatase family metal-dependent hydrolase